MASGKKGTEGRTHSRAKRKKLPIEIRDAVILVGWFVVIAWACAIYFPGAILLPSDEFDGRGNAIAALFSGLAFVGVVAAIFLQMDELRLQRQELKLTRRELERSAEAQERNAEQNRIASMRQSREQFLTARLNAQVAMLQSQEALNKVSLRGMSEDEQMIETNERVIQLSHMRVKIELLNHEARQGFEGVWTASVEKEAMRRWTIGCCRWLVSSYDKNGESVEFSYHKKVFCGYLGILFMMTNDVYPEVCSQVSSILELLGRTPEDPKPYIELFRNSHILISSC